MAAPARLHADPAVVDVRPSWRRSDGAVFVGLAFAAMTVSIMQTMVVPILGAISFHLGTSLADTSWVLTATLVAAAVLTPIFGRLGDQQGKRRMLVACLSLVTVGSLVAALAPSLGVLVVGRALQGAGTGVFPLALSLLRDRVPARQLTTRMAFVSTTLMTGGGIGLVLTGAVVQGGRGYQAIFWLAAALSVLALLGIALLVSESPVTRSGRIDWLGAALFSALLTLLLLALSQGATWGWTSRPWPVAAPLPSRSRRCRADRGRRPLGADRHRERAQRDLPVGGSVAGQRRRCRGADRGAAPAGQPPRRACLHRHLPARRDGVRSGRRGGGSSASPPRLAISRRGLPPAPPAAAVSASPS